MADKVSDTYLSPSGDLTCVNEDWMLHEVYMKKQAKMKGVFVIKMQSVTPSEKRKIIGWHNAWAAREYAKMGKFTTGGVYTMLHNKGYR